MNKILPASIVVLIGLACTVAMADDDRAEIIATFKTYIGVVREFQSSVPSGKSPSGKSNKELRVAAESYFEDVYVPKLEAAKLKICRSRDRELLGEFFRVLAVDTGNASEVPSWILGDIFICQPDLVMKEYKILSIEDRGIVFRHLDFGFLNVTYEKESSIQNYDTLKSKLESIRPK